MNLKLQLMRPFEVKHLHWRVGSTNKDKTSGMALAYIDARHVMTRLDHVCGIDGWQCKYPFAGCCEIGIFFRREEGFDSLSEWIWKSNGAGETDFEGAKGQYSDAFKRAAVMWGIGRYLYELPNVWVPIRQAGRSHIITDEGMESLTKRLPVWATPTGFDQLVEQGKIK